MRYHKKFQLSRCSGRTPSGIIFYTKDFFKKKYKGKLQKYLKSIFGTFNQLHRTCMVSDCIPGVQTLLLIPILMCMEYFMSDDRYVISVINAINGIFNALAICHKLVRWMSIWMSKEALGPQECSQIPYKFYKFG